ncbi:MAG TPA: dockerin type I domain-containing protein [Candidatus Saccharimonadales bacterium]|nr:dockerin type I domain-containing protein [Candidatus Saccharimonadales bacterium]
MPATIKLNFSRYKNLFLLLGVLIIFLSVPLTVYLLQKSPNRETKAATPVVINTNTSYTIPILVLSYFPTKDGVNLDSSVTGYTSSIANVRTKVDLITSQVKTALQDGSKYQGYKNPNALPALNFTTVDQKEFLQPIPVSAQFAPFPDHFKIFSDSSIGVASICNYVQNQGVKEVWVYMYQAGNTAPIESNMAGPYGDVSNSSRSADLPVCSKSYTVYEYNYSRTATEAAHNHGHQIEVLMKNIDNTTMENLFIGPFATYASNDGSGANFHRCGWTHVPPNTSTDYIYNDTRSVWTDCQNWRPDGAGQKEFLSCSAWGCNEIGFHVWRWQNMPGRNNNIGGVTNWWDFYGDWDSAKAKAEKLVYTNYAKQGDINTDGVVNSQDLAILITTWGSTSDLRADINFDGIVSSVDLATLIARWGS